MTYLTMSGEVAEIMEALGRHDAAETLRWAESPAKLEDLAIALAAAEVERDNLAERVSELTVALADAVHSVKAARKSVDGLPKLVEAIWSELPSHVDCETADGCAISRLVEAVDETRRVLKDAVEAAADAAAS
jgi:hypothetical protein